MADKEMLIRALNAAEIKSDKNQFDMGVYTAWFDVVRQLGKEDLDVSLVWNKKLRSKLQAAGKLSGDARPYVDLIRKTYLYAAPHSFDDYCVYIEWNRPMERRFYLPRRTALKPIADALQRLADDELDLLAISLPPGVGKTTLAIFFLTWLSGKFPDEPMLTGSHSNSFVRGVYDECLRIFDNKGDYLWQDVFPTVQVSNTNAKDCRIDLGKRKRFETLEFTSIGTGNAGLYRASTLLYCDDLVSGIEVALSKERLDKLWQTYTDDLRQRKIGNKCKELHIATRWSVHDVIGRLERQYEGSDRAQFISVPAIDTDGNSNFDYKYGVGFSSEFFKEQKEIMDDASFRALYMNEPIEREGLLYPIDELRYYFDLPDGEPDATLSILDTKDKGKDYAFLPVGYVYGNDYYIDYCVCNHGIITDEIAASVLFKHRVKACRVESNSAGGKIAEKIQVILKTLGGITHITTKFTTANKETRIIVNSEWVKNHCLFKDKSMYTGNSEYGTMMRLLTTYSMMGKNKHDDVPDGMAMFADFVQSLSGNSVEVVKRPF